MLFPLGTLDLSLITGSFFQKNTDCLRIKRDKDLAWVSTAWIAICHSTKTWLTSGFCSPVTRDGVHKQEGGKSSWVQNRDRTEKVSCLKDEELFLERPCLTKITFHTTNTIYTYKSICSLSGSRLFFYSPDLWLSLLWLMVSRSWPIDSVLWFSFRA